MSAKGGLYIIWSKAQVAHSSLHVFKSYMFFKGHSSFIGYILLTPKDFKVLKFRNLDNVPSPTTACFTELEVTVYTEPSKSINKPLRPRRKHL